MSKLLTGNDRPLLREIQQYCCGMLLHLTQLLTMSRVYSKDTNEVRAVTLGRLAALGLAMHNYFGKAVQDMGLAEHKGVLESSMRTYDAATKYLGRLEERAEKGLN